MSTQFSGAAVAAQHNPFQHAYKKSALYSQIDSGSNTPMNVSPTSPRTMNHLPTYPQHAPPLRPLKTPGYIPAALRRTEKPAGRSPPNVDSGIDTPNTSWSTGGLFGQSTGDTTPISRVATEDMRSIYDDTPLSPVAGPITRNHWQCGGIFCYQHLQKQVRLNEHALFHPEGDWHKACDRCHTQFREWEQMRSSRTNSESSGSIESPAAVQIEPPQAKRPECAPKASFLSQSFGGGTWNWSTF
ncbi:hypothetical protein SLS60_007944 [Paraconiothyrium brasiliense]|uniref:C2H2-type domain-containing protein n=1 Tax=Paraconiothyrium brasiliense TaxID=300254 RepID=A0ABR3R331_9PLEO